MSKMSITRFPIAIRKDAPGPLIIVRSIRERENVLHELNEFQDSKTVKEQIKKWMESKK